MRFLSLATGYELGANLLNFGALLAFMGVNAAAFVRYYLHEKDKKLINLLPPVLGFVICALLWLNLSTKALIFGSIWMAIGIAFGAWKTKGFRGELVNFDLPPEDAEA
jgi:putrescine importer